MSIKKARFQRYVATLRAVCRSPAVDRYRIGYTQQAIQKRAAPYLTTNWPHFVAIADRMCRDDALELEERLFKEMQKDKRDILYRKYDRTIRDGPYRRSAGGATDRGDEAIHGVYIAWAEEPLE